MSQRQTGLDPTRLDDYSPARRLLIFAPRPFMPRLLWLGIVLAFCLANGGCAAIGAAAGLYALSQTDFVQEQLDDL